MIHPAGYFKIWRELFNKPIWLNSTPEQKAILITLLAMANFNDKEWEWKGQKFKAEKGQFVTSLDSIVKNCGRGITIQNVRTALKRFEKLEFLTNESTKTGRLVTIINWDLYQGNSDEPNQAPNKGLTKSQQRPNKDLTPKEEVKNDKNDKNKSIIYIVDYLNEKTGKSYKSTSKKTQDLIKARLNEGFTQEDFFKVIDIKVSEWKDDPRMEKYLRPETLFSNKFEGYLNQRPSKPIKNSTSRLELDHNYDIDELEKKLLARGRSQ